MILQATVDCAGCGTAYQGWWQDESADTLQDLDEPPVSVQECPSCGRKQQETWPGWISYTEAGLATGWDYDSQPQGTARDAAD